MTNKLKIAIFSDAFYPTNSGVVSYTVTTAKELSDRGHKVFLFVPKSKDTMYKRILNKNVKVFRYTGLKAFFYPDFKFTNILSPGDFKLFKKIDPDVVYYQTPFTLGLKGIMLAKIFNKPIVGVFHTRIAHKEYISNLGIIGKKINLEKLAWRYLKYFYKECDAIISPSQDIKRELDARKFHTKIIAINNFVDTKDLKNYKTSIDVKDKSFLYLGRISVEKNIPCLIKGFKKVVSKDKEAHLYILGGGPMFDDIKLLIKKIGLQDNIHMLGMIDRDVILKTDLLTRFKAIVTMSNTEVQPLSLIEAMFKKLPILGPDTDGIRELVKSNGILVKKNSSDEMAKAMLKLIENPKYQKKLSQAAIEKSKEYNSKILIKKLEKELIQIVKTDKRKNN